MDVRPHLPATNCSNYNVTSVLQKASVVLCCSTAQPSGGPAIAMHAVTVRPMMHAWFQTQSAVQAADFFRDESSLAQAAHTLALAFAPAAPAESDLFAPLYQSDDEQLECQPALQVCVAVPLSATSLLPLAWFTQ